MKNKYLRGGSILLVSGLIGCAHLTEIPKELWGSSTRALEESRSESISKTYLGDVAQCYSRVLETAKDNKWEVFIADKRKHMIVFMNIPGSIDTTEVGVFFSPVETEKTKVEVTSLSPQAKVLASNLLFAELNKSLNEI